MTRAFFSNWVFFSLTTVLILLYLLFTYNFAINCCLNNVKLTEMYGSLFFLAVLHRIAAPQPVVEPGPLRWKPRFLTTRLSAELEDILSAIQNWVFCLLILFLQWRDVTVMQNSVMFPKHITEFDILSVLIKYSWLLDISWLNGVCFGRNMASLHSELNSR